MSDVADPSACGNVSWATAGGLFCCVLRKVREGREGGQESQEREGVGLEMEHWWVRVLLGPASGPGCPQGLQ